MSPPSLDQTLVDADRPTMNPADERMPAESPSAGSIERELSSLMSTVETPAPDVDAVAPSSRRGAPAPSSRRGAALAPDASFTPQPPGVAEPPAASPSGRGERLDMPPSLPTPRVDALGGAIEALRAWLVPSPDGAKIVIWSPTRPLGAVEVVVLSTQAGANLRSLLS